MERVLMFLPTIIAVALIALAVNLFIRWRLGVFGEDFQDPEWRKRNALKVGAQIGLPLAYMWAPTAEELIFRAPQQTIAKKLEVYEERAREGERYRTVATLAAGIGHELKNPLASIQTFLEFFPQRREDPAFCQQFHEVMESEVKRLQQIAQGLMDFSKPQPLDMQPLEVGSVLGDVLVLTKAKLEESAIRVEAAYTHNGSVVMGDATQLKQVFLNLILNAKEAMEQGGTLTIATEAVNGHVEVRIADTGCGIHPKDLPHLFEPFFTRKATGNGLGLSIVQNIIHEHHGTITVQSAPGRGTTFTVRLPMG